MESIIKEAFRVAILTEKNSYDLYRNASTMVPDGKGKQVLERLAQEELKLIDEMLKYSPDSLADILRHPKDHYLSTADAYYRESTLERRLFNHLRVALLEKHACVDRYATYLKTFREPAVCKVFELALAVSRRQFAVIAEEYRHADPRLPKQGDNRRAKRIHLKTANRPSPNKHTQLYISLQDAGRTSPI